MRSSAKSEERKGLSSLLARRTEETVWKQDSKPGEKMEAESDIVLHDR